MKWTALIICGSTVPAASAHQSHSAGQNPPRQQASGKLKQREDGGLFPPPHLDGQLAGPDEVKDAQGSRQRLTQHDLVTVFQIEIVDQFLR